MSLQEVIPEVSNDLNTEAKNIKHYIIESSWEEFLAWESSFKISDISQLKEAPLRIKKML